MLSHHRVSHLATNTKRFSMNAKHHQPRFVSVILDNERLSVVPMSIASQLTKFEAGSNECNKIYNENLAKQVEDEPEVVKRRKRPSDSPAVGEAPPHYDPKSVKNKRLAKVAERVVGKRRTRRKVAPEAVVISPERAIQRIKRAVIVPEPPNMCQEHFRGYLSTTGQVEKRSLWDLSCMVPELTSQEVMMLHDVDFDLAMFDKAVLDVPVEKEDQCTLPQSSPIVLVMKPKVKGDSKPTSVEMTDGKQRVDAEEIGTSMVYEDDMLSSVCEIPETPNQMYEDIDESDVTYESCVESPTTVPPDYVDFEHLIEIPQSPYVVDFELFDIHASA